MSAHIDAFCQLTLQQKIRRSTHFSKTYLGSVLGEQYIDNHKNSVNP